jgi:hypothetical protein
MYGLALNLSVLCFGFDLYHFPRFCRSNPGGDAIYSVASQALPATATFRWASVGTISRKTASAAYRCAPVGSSSVGLVIFLKTGKIFSIFSKGVPTLGQVLQNFTPNCGPVVLSCFDRIVLTGTFPEICHADAANIL